VPQLMARKQEIEAVRDKGLQAYRQSHDVRSLSPQHTGDPHCHALPLITPTFLTSGNLVVQKANPSP
jgi:hypothetical protein